MGFKTVENYHATPKFRKTHVKYHALDKPNKRVSECDFSICVINLTTNPPHKSHVSHNWDFNGHIFFCCFFLGASINTQTEETQETALTLACCGGFTDVAEFLIKAGADIEQGASTPLMEAAQEGHLDLVR